MKNFIAKMGAALSTSVMVLALSGCGEDSGTNANNRNGGTGTAMVDPRDGQSYKTVTIGDQTWMAVNLNYQIVGSMCYGNNPVYCQKYGRLYSWNEAMNACPNGWHLPSRGEFETLLYSVGGKNVIGMALKSRSGWRDGGNGRDEYGFGALPAGLYYSDGSFDGDGYGAFFWSSTEYAGYYAYSLDLHYLDEDEGVNNDEKSRGFSVRCVKDPFSYSTP